jgi:glycine/D-amino acid oxidase-like deaminating enzyme
MAMASADVVILGGGIAALWILDRLRAAGYSTVLLSAGELGAGQSIAAQGIIHGGMKYAIPGFEEQALPFLAEMPAIWRAALAGRGGPDLRQARVLAEQFLVHVRAGLLDGLTAGAARGSLRGASREIAKADWPAALRDAGGRLFAVDEPVVDVPSVLAALAGANAAAVFCLPEPAKGDPKFSDGVLHWGDLHIDCQRLVLAAGRGNEDLLLKFGLTEVATQRRPLHQVMVSGMPSPLYAHVVGRSPKPLATVTSHATGAGDWVWYVGGAIAEDGAGKSAAELLALARKKLPELFPGADFSHVDWRTWAVDRAEFGGGEGVRPGDAVLLERGGIMVAWPTKLALAPRLAALVEAALATAIKPSVGAKLPSLPSAKVALAPWQGGRT